MKTIKVGLMGLCLFVIACSKAKDELGAAIDNLPKTQAKLDQSQYDKADPQSRILDLPAASVLYFSENLMLNNHPSFDGGGLGVLLQKGTQLSTDEAYDLEEKATEDFCVLATDLKDIYSKMSGNWLIVESSFSKTQPTLLSSFFGVEVKFANDRYQSITVRGQTVQDLEERCFGGKVQVLTPKVK